MTAGSEPERIAGIGPLLERFPVLFVDVWGVLHDGTAFPGVAETLIQVRAGGATVILVSNSPSRPSHIADRLGRLGIRADAYDHIITSGELSRRYLLDRRGAEDWPPIFLVREGNGPSWLPSLPHPVVERVEDAAMIVVVGMPQLTEKAACGDGLRGSLHGSLHGIVAQGRQHGIPMICADSDELYPEYGAIRLGPGWLARRYREAGGEVVEFGKPNAPIYLEALELAGHPPREEVLVIGDNIATDILGGACHGFASLLVLEGGVLGDVPPDALSEQYLQHGASPDYVAQRLAW